MAIEVIDQSNLGFQLPYMEIFIFVMLAQMFFDNYINLRQMKVLKNKEYPLVLKKLNISEEQYRKSQDYSLDKL